MAVAALPFLTGCGDLLTASSPHSMAERPTAIARAERPVGRSAIVHAHLSQAEMSNTAPVALPGGVLAKQELHACRRVSAVLPIPFHRGAQADQADAFDIAVIGHGAQPLGVYP
jgi:hypothetical protein